MKLKTIVRRARKLAKRYRISDGSGFRLKDIDPSDTGKLEREDKGIAQELLTTGIQALAELQERLYAQDRWAVLLVFQAIDAAGKDSAIKHVMSGVNPQGCQVYSFGVPSAHDLDHDYLWRCLSVLPERGRIGIFNRSYYEEVIVVRVHPEFLARQKVPAALLNDKELWQHRFEDIRNVEQYLSRNGVLIRKFFLHVSKKEQKKRFLERLEKPEKNWKFNPEDLEERERWDDYQAAYEKTIRATATKHAPWYVVPADHKWFTRLVVASAIIEGLAGLDLRFPEVTSAQKREIARARRLLGDR
ncbi:MAG: polyphosphate kinase 2 family protein [Steroidobacteraceae bacterium]